MIGILTITTMGFYSRREKSGSTPNTTKKTGKFIAQEQGEQFSGWKL